MSAARASGTDLASSLKRNTFWTLGVRPGRGAAGEPGTGGHAGARDGGGYAGAWAGDRSRGYPRASAICG